MSIAEQFENKIVAGELAEPIPRWEIILKRVLIWTFLVLFVLLGAISVGILAWFLFDPADLAIDTGKFNIFGKLLEDLPLFWAIISLLSAVIAVWIFTKSPRGYRFRIVAVVIACLVAFIALGAAMAFGGVSDRLESLASSYLLPYRNIAQPFVQKLLQPQEGTIIGKVGEISTSTFELVDPNGKTWQVKINPETKVPATKIQSGSCLRVLGEASTGTNAMQAGVISYCPRGVRLRIQKIPAEIRTSTVRIIN